MKIKQTSTTLTRISNLHEKHQHEDLLEHEKHQCGYQNNRARTSLANQRHIKSISMETSLSANWKLTIKHKNCSSKLQRIKKVPRTKNE